MRKASLLDLHEKDGVLSGDRYLFTGSSYEFERAVRYPDESASPQDTSEAGEVSVSLPLELLNFRTLKLPFSDREKLAKVVPFELQGLMLEGAGDIVFDTVVLGSSGDEWEVLVAYIEKSVLGEILAKLSESRIDPPAVTSLELRTVLASGKDDLASRLLGPVMMTPEERMEAVRSELQNPTINLRTGALAYTKDTEKSRRMLRTTVILSVLLALLIHSYLGFGMLTTKTRAAAMKKELRGIYTGLFPKEKTVSDELYQMKSHLKEIRDKGDALIGVAPLRLLLELSHAAPPGVSFSEMGIERDLFTLKGEASSMAEVEKTKTSLSEVLKDVTVSDIRPSAGGKTLFTVVAKGWK
ncbi:MAG: hypothetical protein M1497_09050 [Nitrospirae bacterium]|nr:hypothetical protein [Nitrospirota bacterium]